MTAALLPAMKIHLAWLNDAESDAGDLAAAMAAEPIRTSRRQLQAVVKSRVLCH